MIELGASKAAPADNDLIKDSSEATFMADVIEASQEVPVIVDFWAPWCGPCKTLGPALEAAVTAANGAVRMVKVDVDQNQMIASQLRIQSIPTVYAFWQGQPVDGFQGAVPASEIKDFVARVAAHGGGAPDDGLAEAVAAAEDMLAEGAAVDAAQTFAAILGEDPANAAAMGGLARAQLALGELDQAEALLNSAPEDIAGAPELEAAREARRERMEEMRQQQRERMRQAMLERYDANGDGELDDTERETARAEAEQRRQELIEQFDANGDGELDGDERTAVREHFRQERENRRMDVNGDGVVDDLDVQAAINRVSGEQRLHDFNRDGFHDANDVSELIRRIQGQEPQK